MLALLLYLWLGPRAALAELMAELLGIALLGGGRGKLVARPCACFWPGFLAAA
jgi:hypothetical protein